MTKYNKYETKIDWVKQNFYQELSQNYNNYHVIYTDSSKTNEGVGCSFISNLNNVYQFKLSPHFIIFSTELYDIYRAIQYFNQENHTHAVICSDSLSYLLSLRRIYQRHPVEQLIKYELLLSQYSRNVLLLIKGRRKYYMSGNKLKNNKSDVSALILEG